MKPWRDRAVSKVWANAGKIGFVSSGVTNPTSPALLRRNRLGRSYPRTSREVSTTCRVASATPGLPLRTRLTVASLTSACSAMSASRALIAFPLGPLPDQCWPLVARHELEASQRVGKDDVLFSCPAACGNHTRPTPYGRNVAISCRKPPVVQEIAGIIGGDIGLESGPGLTWEHAPLDGVG